MSDKQVSMQVYSNIESVFKDETVGGRAALVANIFQVLLETGQFATNLMTDEVIAEILVATTGFVILEQPRDKCPVCDGKKKILECGPSRSFVAVCPGCGGSGELTKREARNYEKMP